MFMHAVSRGMGVLTCSASLWVAEVDVIGSGSSTPFFVSHTRQHSSPGRGRLYNCRPRPCAALHLQADHSLYIRSLAGRDLGGEGLGAANEFRQLVSLKSFVAATWHTLGGPCLSRAFAGMKKTMQGCRTVTASTASVCAE